jgi:hypothetical protein
MLSKPPIINSLQKKGWRLVNSRQHSLGSLQGKGLGSYKLVVLLGTINNIGATYFQIFLQNTRGKISQQPVIIGLHNQGSYPSYNWVEIISFSPRVSYGSEKEQLVDISSGELTQPLFQYLADLIPPGGHMMVQYDSPEQSNTARSLALGIPPVATPLGYLLWSVGCGIGFRDWYFAEGGTEGPRKLQGYKALNSRHARLKAKETAQELAAFLDRHPSATP